MPPNLHFSADIFIARKIPDETLSYKAYSNAINYILLKPGTSITNLQKKLQPFYAKYDFGSERTLSFQPVQSIHLHSNLPDEPFVNSSIEYICIFSAIAAFILFIACINYINLTTSRTMHRTREVGVRKVMGAMRKQLIFQFIIESVLLFIIVLPFSLLIAKLAWQPFG